MGNRFGVSSNTLMIGAFGAQFNVHLTPGAVRALKLRAQLAVWLIVKTHSCHLVGE